MARAQKRENRSLVSPLLIPLHHSFLVQFSGELSVPAENMIHTTSMCECVCGTGGEKGSESRESLFARLLLLLLLSWLISWQGSWCSAQAGCSEGSRVQSVHVCLSVCSFVCDHNFGELLCLGVCVCVCVCDAFICGNCLPLYKGRGLVENE